jgi:hypothetical protein
MCIDRRETRMPSNADPRATALDLGSTEGMEIGDIIGIDLYDSSHLTTTETAYAKDRDWTQHWTTIATIPGPTSVTITHGVPAGTRAFGDKPVVTNRWRELASLSV